MRQLAAVSGGSPRITEVTRTRLRVPFRPRVAEWNDVLVSGFGVVDIFRVGTEDPEVVGWGEQLAEATAMAAPHAPDLAELAGARPPELLSLTSGGIGLQTALYDAAARSLGVPLRHLLGLPEHRRHVPLAWWNTKMPAELLAEEAADAVREGYLAHKIKARPWFDVYEQVAAMSAVTPPEYAFDLDWNQMLLTVGDAAPVLAELETYPRVAIFETPIRQRDLEGYRRLRDKASRPIVEHFVETPVPMAVAGEMFDGFVVSGYSIAQLVEQATLAAAFNKPFWIQHPGTGLSTALVLQLGAVLSHATWPSVSCLNIYADDLLTEPLRLSGGLAAVPDGPGLGVQIDPKALHTYRVPDDFVATPRPRLLTVTLPGRHTRHYATIGQLWTDCLAGNLPVAARGARLELRDVATDQDAAELRKRAGRGPVVETS